MTDKKPIITCMECGKVMSSPAQMIAHEGFPCALQQGYRQGFKDGAKAERERLRKEVKRHFEAGTLVSWASKFGETKELSK